jgi:virulence factor Mce-like protein
MRRARRQQSVFANPVLVGAVAVLVILVAVFLAYDANQGLPFVPTRELKVDIADGSNLVPGNDVREGGYRIGIVSSVDPILLPGGQTAAQLTLQLSASRGKVPIDSQITVLSKSALGLKYVDLIKGQSSDVYPEGATMPISQTKVPVQLDQIFDTFNDPTRTAIQQDLVGFGDTFAARGSSLNETIQSLPPLLGHLRPVTQYLAAPPTELMRALDSLNRFMSTVSPVAQTNAQLFTDMATTFHAISQSPPNLEATIAQSPSTLQVSTASLKTQQPVLADLTTLGQNLAPATAQLPPTLPVLDPAIEAGTQTLARSPVLNANLQQAMGALKTLALAPGTNVALNALVSTVNTLNPMVRYLGPYQTVCNDWNYMWTYLADVVSERTSFGFAQRGMLMSADPLQPNNPASEPATAPVNGGGPDLPIGGNAYFHGQVYGAAVDNNGLADCESGQRGYVKQLNYYDPQHRNFATNPHTPGDQGPTYAGRPRVPAGETFSRAPSTGPQLPPVPGDN